MPADAKNVAVYQCKANYTGDGEGNELTINKGDHVNVLEKSDGGMCSDDTSKCRYMHVFQCPKSKLTCTHYPLCHQNTSINMFLKAPVQYGKVDSSELKVYCIPKIPLGMYA